MFLLIWLIFPNSRLCWKKFPNICKLIWINIFLLNDQLIIGWETWIYVRTYDGVVRLQIALNFNDYLSSWFVRSKSEWKNVDETRFYWTHFSVSRFFFECWNDIEDRNFIKIKNVFFSQFIPREFFNRRRVL